jgi:peptidyl-prolyl cis-trans isomerase C
MSRRRSTAASAGAVIIAFAALVPLSACSEKSAPAGQVVAVVNGSEVTTSELQAEAEARGADLRNPETRNQLLEVVVQRHLQAAAAAERGLDKNPNFLAHKRRAEQQVLAQMYLLSARAGAEDADIQDARMFILRNPQLFEARELMVVDRIGFAPAGAVSPAEVDKVKSLQEAEQLLRSKKLRFERQSATLDPADVPPQIASNLSRLQTGEVFFDTQGNAAMFAVITARNPAPVPMAEQIARAKAILKRQRQQEALNRAVQDLRKRAKINYQKGYGPAAPMPQATKRQPKEEPTS